MAYFSGGLICGFMLGMFVGIWLGFFTVYERCQAGWHWRDIDYNYSCTVAKRP